jgi:hypothetical protein
VKRGNTIGEWDRREKRLSSEEKIRSLKGRIASAFKPLQSQIKDSKRKQNTGKT